MSKETGGQAFPRQQWEYDGQNNVLQYQEDGMTLRDYIAVSALSGMLGGTPGSHLRPHNAAKEAYEYADAMIKARAE